MCVREVFHICQSAGRWNPAPVSFAPNARVGRYPWLCRDAATSRCRLCFQATLHTVPLPPPLEHRRLVLFRSRPQRPAEEMPDKLSFFCFRRWECCCWMGSRLGREHPTTITSELNNKKYWTEKT